MTMRSKPTYVSRSSVKAVLASKMFMSSRHKDKIRAALDDFENVELIQQLDEYLGDEYIELKKPKKDTKSKKKSSSESSSETSNEHTVDTGIKAIRPSKSKNEEVVDEVDESNTESQDTETQESDSNDEVSSSKAIKSTTIIMHPEYEDAVNEIKGFLNANSTTAGVSRVRKKDDEIWIYYKDSVNLNNIMDTVIELLSVDGYLWMIFNRLARSENAIVFAILDDDTLKNLPSPPTSHDV